MDADFTDLQRFTEIWETYSLPRKSIKPVLDALARSAEIEAEFLEARAAAAAGDVPALIADGTMTVAEGIVEVARRSLFGADQASGITKEARKIHHSAARRHLRKHAHALATEGDATTPAIRGWLEEFADLPAGPEVFRDEPDPRAESYTLDRL